jgi:hypothetical protein
VLNVGGTPTPADAIALFPRSRDPSVAVRRKKGDSVGAHADMAAAKAIQADIEEELARYSIK